MQHPALELCVLGNGHLAAAVRVQLRLLALSSLADCDDEPGARRVVLACSDYASASSFAEVNRRALESRSAILFAWLCEDKVGIGPLVVPPETPCFECQPPRKWDFSLDHTAHEPVCPPQRPTLNPDTHLRRLAQFGALLLTRELSAFRLGVWNARLIGRVVEFDPPCIFPEIVELTRAPLCPACGVPATAATCVDFA